MGFIYLAQRCSDNVEYMIYEVNAQLEYFVGVCCIRVQYTGACVLLFFCKQDFMFFVCFAYRQALAMTE